MEDTKKLILYANNNSEGDAARDMLNEMGFKYEQISHSDKPYLIGSNFIASGLVAIAEISGYTIYE